MLKPYAVQRFVLTFVAAALALALAGAAAADTIYLKNGRTIRSSHVRVEGDRVVFIQYGGTVKLPMSIVDRIEADTNAEPEPTPTPPPPAEDPEADPDAPPAEGDEVPEEQTPEFWQDQVRSIEAEREQIRLQIEDLRRTERAFLFSHRSTADTRAAIEAAESRLGELDEQMAALEQEARRAGVPPGWLRLPPGGGGGQGGQAGMPGGSGGSGGPGGSGG